MPLSSLLLTVFGISVAAKIHTIQVGQSGLTFSPQTTSAQPGDHVVFELHPSHDVASSNFSEPCQPNKVYYSGDYDMSSKGKKRFVINITNDDPIYFYCSVNNHCQDGMVGGINTPYGTLTRSLLTRLMKIQVQWKHYRIICFPSCSNGSQLQSRRARDGRGTAQPRGNRQLGWRQCLSIVSLAPSLGYH
jgi:plastocyanin